MLKTKKRSPLMRLLSAATALGSAAFMLPAMPQLSAAAASFELWICGTRVTTSNASDVLGDGVFSYDAFDNELTISGYCASISTIIDSDIEGLTINVASDSVLHAEGNHCMLLSAVTTITGNGKLTLQGYSLSKSTISTEASLIIQDVTLDIDSNYNAIDGYSSNSDTLYIQNSNIDIVATNEAICDFAEIKLTDCVYNIPANAYYRSRHLYQNSWDSDLAKIVRIVRSQAEPEPEPPTPTNKAYDLWISGTQVTEQNASNILGNGVFSYNAAANTLTISGNYTASTENPADIIKSNLNGLIIDVASDSILTNMGHSDWEHSATLMYLNGSTTIKGSGKLTAVTDSTSIWIESGQKLKIDNANLDITSNWYPIRAMSSANVNLHLRQSTLHLKSNQNDDIIDGFKGGINFDDCHLDISYTLNTSNGYVDLGEGWIKPTTYYSLYVCGTRVSSANAYNILKNGKFSYSESENTLYIKGSYTNSSSSDVVRNYIDGLRIYVAADAELKSTAEGYNCMTLLKSATITGSKKLTVTSDTNDAIAVSGGANLTIENTELTANGKEGLVGGNNSALAFNDAAVTVNATNRAVFNFNSGITFTDCWIETSGATASGGGIKSSNGTLLSHVFIEKVRPYDLTICGTQVTNANANDILGDGKFSYNAADKRLDIKGSVTNDQAVEMIYSNISGLKINVVNDAVLTQNSTKSCITVKATTKVTGAGKLTVNAANSTAFYVNGSTKLTFENVTAVLNAKRGIEGNYSASLAFNTANMNITATQYAVYYFKAGITFTDSTITAPSGATVANDSIIDSTGAVAKTLKTTATVYYDLYVRGVRVTSLNASNILGDGRLWYNAENKTLYLNGYESDTANTIIQNDINGLTLYVVADSSLLGDGQMCINTEGCDMTITGEGKLTLNSTSTAIFAGAATLTIKDTKLEAGGVYGIAGHPSQEKLIVINSEVTATGTQGAICDFANGIQLKTCGIVSPAGASVQNGSIKNANGSVATEVTIIPQYDLYISGTRVDGNNKSDILGNGKFSFDPKTNTLFIKGDYTTTNNVAVVENEIDGLIVKVTKASTITAPTDIFFSDGYDLTITGNYKLTLNSTHGDAIYVNGLAEVTIKDANLYANCEITGDNGGEKLTVINSVIHAESKYGAIWDFGKGLVLQDCYIANPADAVISDEGDICYANGQYAKVVDINLPISYDVTVAGTPVTNLNAADILGDGKFSYDANTNVLTVKGDYTTSRAVSIIKNNNFGLTVNVAADSVLKSAGTAIYSKNRNITITGPGKLTLKSTGSHSGIDIEGGSLTIRDANLDVSGVSGISGELEDEKLVIDHSTVHAEGTEGAVRSFENSIELLNCKIDSPANAAVYATGICTPDGSFATAVDIVPVTPVEIITQPTNKTSTIGATAKFSVSATGDELSYQWQNYTSSGWKDSGLATAKTAELSVPVTAARDGYKYRCVINGKVISDTAVLKVKPAFTTQPSTFTGKIGDTAKFTVVVSGAGTLSYQWQCDTGKGFKDSTASGAKTATMSIPVTAARDGYKYRCIVKSSNGTSATSKTVTLKVKTAITTQPESFTGKAGTTAKFTVAASGAGTLSYQWQNYTSSGWKDSGLATAKTAELSVPVTAARDGYKYRCIVTSSNGTTATSNAVTLKVQVAITTQPTGFNGKIGDTAKFTVAASGAGTLTYQWQCDTGKGFKDSTASGAKTATMSIPVTAARDGYKYRCIVTAPNGTTATSNEVSLKVKAAITTQPKTVTDVIGATAKFTVAASGAGTLSYQWQCDTGKGFKDSTASGAKTATLSIPVTAARDGYKYRCIVTSSNGTTATSNTVTLKVKTAITTQPVSFTGKVGATAKFTVAASGAGTLTYQWQNYTSSGWKDSGLATAQTAELSVPVTAARNGYKYRCIVTSTNGTTATSNAVTLTVQ